MKRILLATLFALATAGTALGQEKGVDQQNERIKDNSTNRTPAVNGTKTDTGTGRGVDFGKGKTVVPPPAPNPYRFTFPKDVLIKAASELMTERKLVLDESVSKMDEGIIISQPFTFTKGSVVSSSELNRISEVPLSDFRGWTRGRYTLIVEVIPVDGTGTNVSVNARVEGRSEGPLGGEWITLKSLGVVEQEFIVALVERLTGGPPPAVEP